MSDEWLEDDTRVRIQNTLIYDGRVGSIRPTSGHPDDPWDYNVLLDDDPNADRRASRLIGVHRGQVVAL